MARADMEGAKGLDRFVCIGPIGSRQEYTTYNFDKKVVRCGCFTGNLDEFAEKVEKTHANNPQYLAEYLGFIAYIRTLKVVQP